MTSAMMSPSLSNPPSMFGASCLLVGESAFAGVCSTFRALWNNGDLGCDTIAEPVGDSGDTDSAGGRKRPDQEPLPSCPGVLGLLPMPCREPGLEPGLLELSFRSGDNVDME